MNLDDRRDLVTQLHNSDVVSFANNCLPVSLAALPLVNKQYPDARVVIGVTRYQGKPGGKAEFLREFLTARVPDFNPVYHAWIDVGNGDLLDLTWGSTYAEQFPHLHWHCLDLQEANALGLDYVPVITAAEDIAVFHARIMRPDAAGIDHVAPLHAREAHATPAATSAVPYGGEPAAVVGNMFARWKACLKGLSSKWKGSGEK